MFQTKREMTSEDFMAKYSGWQIVKGRQPTEKALERWASDGVAKATDGCRVEPDGVCQHSHRSWLLVLGFI